MNFVRMSDAEFTRVASSMCERWSDRSVWVARALLVDGDQLSDVAAKYEMSSQQANVVRTRFLAKAEKYRLASFMAREKPKLAVSLEPYKTQMQTLRHSGYTVDQIISYLRDQGVEISETVIRKFLKELP